MSKVSDTERAIQAAQDDATQVFDGNLLVNDAEKAQRLLHDAWLKLDQAATLGAPASALASLREKVQGGLDRLDQVTYTTSSTLVSFATATPTVDLAGLVRGPDGAAYVIDRKAAAVLRVDLAARTSKVLFKKGAGGGKGIGIAGRARDRGSRRARLRRRAGPVALAALGRQGQRHPRAPEAGRHDRAGQRRHEHRRPTCATPTQGCTSSTPSIPARSRSCATRRRRMGAATRPTRRTTWPPLLTSRACARSTSTATSTRSRAMA